MLKNPDHGFLRNELTKTKFSIDYDTQLFWLILRNSGTDKVLLIFQHLKYVCWKQTPPRF